MKKKKPLISICIPTFNGEEFIEEALLSAINQTYRPLEIVISDDNSKDRTLEIIDRIKKISTIPFYIYTHTPSGIGVNWNYCIEKANGEYIKFLFQDDSLNKECIEEMANVSLKDEQVSFVFCKRGIIHDYIDKQWIDTNSDLQANLNFSLPTVFDGNYFLKECNQLILPPRNKIGEPVTTLIRKADLVRIGGFNSFLRQSLDYELLYRIMLDRKVGYIDKKLVTFRIHKDQATAKNKKSKLDEIPLYYWLLYKNLKIYLHPQVVNQIRFKRFGGIVVLIIYWFFGKLRILYHLKRRIHALITF